MSEEELQQVRELADTDREVRAHEQAHKSVGGQYSGGMSFEYQQGPDGNRYAVAGEVSIDTSSERDPQATINKMQQVRAAAMAPAEPSGQDRSVAAAAAATETEARKELAQQTAAAQSGAGGQQGEETVASEDVAQSGDSGKTNGSSAVSNTSTNPYVQRYQESGAGQYTSAASSYQSLAMSRGYRSIDVVA